MVAAPADFSSSLGHFRKTKKKPALVSIETAGPARQFAAGVVLTATAASLPPQMIVASSLSARVTKVMSDQSVLPSFGLYRPETEVLASAVQLHRLGEFHCPLQLGRKPERRRQSLSGSSSCRFGLSSSVR